MLNIPIIYEEDTFLVIEKPAGIVVNRADSVIFNFQIKGKKNL